MRTTQLYKHSRDFKLLILMLGWFSTGSQLNGQKPPNIILIYADDLGYSDIGCYGNKYGARFIETPNIDRFAAESMKFTNAYSPAPICSPSRAALLTGKSPARLKFEFVTRNSNEQYNWNDSSWVTRFRKRLLIPPPYTLNLPLEEKTIAEVLKEQGYSTAMVGKWHVSSHYKKYNGWNPDFGPSKQGFDWTGDTFGAWGIPARKERKQLKEGDFPPDELTDKAISYLQQKHEKPFFLFVSHYYVHDPLDTTITWILDKYRVKAKKMQAAFTEEQIEYAAMVETFDHYVGQLIRAIDAAGLRGNTLVVFTSDNGGRPAYSFNRPFRGSKWNLYEGGIRVPMLMRYSGKIKKHTVSNIPVTQMDFLPTFYQLATGRQFQDKGIDGTSIASLFKNNVSTTIQNRSLIWHFPYYHSVGDFDKASSHIGIEDGYVSRSYPSSAIRKGRYKLIYFYEDERTELYDLDSDIGEQNDISIKMAGKNKELKEELLAYLKMADARLPKRK